MKDYSSFKQQVIKSGIPLESTIRKYLDSFNFVINGEYTYERNDKLFSIDTFATDTIDFPLKHRSNLINLNLLIECKYKEPNHAWVFASYPNPTPTTLIHTNYIDFTFDKRLKEYGYTFKLKSKRKRHWRNLDEIYWRGLYFPERASLVNAATEVVDNRSFNPKTITEAVHQIVYGTGDMIVNETLDLSIDEIDFMDKKEKLFIQGYLASIIYPMVITTADLYLLKPNQTIEDIKKSKGINESFIPVDYVLFEYISNHELQRYILMQFEKNKTRLLKSGFFSESTFQSKIHKLAFSNIIIAVVKLEAFNKFLKQSIAELSKYFRNIAKDCVLTKR